MAHMRVDVSGDIEAAPCSSSLPVTAMGSERERQYLLAVTRRMLGIAFPWDPTDPRSPRASTCRKEGDMFPGTEGLSPRAARTRPVDSSSPARLCGCPDSLLCSAVGGGARHF